jgi:hypothetical protein
MEAPPQGQAESHKARILPNSVRTCLVLPGFPASAFYDPTQIAAAEWVREFAVTANTGTRRECESIRQTCMMFSTKSEKITRETEQLQDLLPSLRANPRGRSVDLLPAKYVSPLGGMLRAGCNSVATQKLRGKMWIQMRHYPIAVCQADTCSRGWSRTDPFRRRRPT